MRFVLPVLLLFASATANGQGFFAHVTAVPEPTAIPESMLALLSIGGFAWWLRRKRGR